MPQPTRLLPALATALLAGCTTLTTTPTHPPVPLGTHPAVTPVTHNREPQSYDWPTRHAATKADVAQRRPDLVFLGDSILHNLGGPVTEPTRPPVAPDVWNAHYAPRNAANLGFGWDRTENVLYRLHDGALDGASPRLIVVMIGTNNLSIAEDNEPATARAIAQGITAVCDLAHASCPDSRLLLLAILPRNDPAGLRREALREQVNQLISRLDARPHVTFADLAQVFYDDQGRIPRDLMHDGLHPTAEGYRRMAEALEPHIDPAVPRP